MSSKLLCFLIVLLILPFFLPAQTWKTNIDLNLTVNDDDRIDLYTNSDGNHVILHTSSQLKFYLFSYNGTQVRSYTIDNSINENPRLSCISGFLDTVIVVWKEGSYIYGKRTTDAGQNWTNLTSIELDYQYCNGLEIWPTEDILHVVWSESDSDEDGSYETYHRPLDYDGSWGTKKQVTDYEGEEGGFPSVTSSANRIHVAYTECYSINPVGNDGLSKNRDKYNTNWQNPFEIFDETGRSYVIATSQKLHTFYYDFEFPSFYYYDLYHKSSNLGSTSWGSSTRISQLADIKDAPVDMTVSSNDSLHIVFDGKYYKEYTGNWENTFTFTNASFSYFNKISSNSNDIYICWIEDDYPDYKLKLKQRDYIPLAPQNLYVDLDNNNHPRINWDANNEADLKGYHVYRDIPAISSTTRLTSSPITTTSYVDDEYVQGESYQAYYYAKAIDQYDNLSTSSNYDDIWVMPTNKGKLIKSGTLVSSKFELGQNYPNPFNPFTSITFNIPRESNVKLTIYSITGEKIAVLINGIVETGFHSIEWNGQNQNGMPVSSGVYIYELIAENRRLVKKMFLAK